MSLHLGAGRLTIDQGGVTSFDSNDELYHNITTGLAGSLSIPLREAINNNAININTNHLIGSCNAFCTHLVGSVKFTGGSNTMPANVWHAYEGGSIFWVLSHFTGITSNPFLIYPTNIVKYEFFVSGGNVFLNERVWARSSVAFDILAHTVWWKLKAGRFN